MFQFPDLSTSKSSDALLTLPPKRSQTDLCLLSPGPNHHHAYWCPSFLLSQLQEGPFCTPHPKPSLTYKKENPISPALNQWLQNLNAFLWSVGLMRFHTTSFLLHLWTLSSTQRGLWHPFRSLSRPQCLASAAPSAQNVLPRFSWLAPSHPSRLSLKSTFSWKPQETSSCSSPSFIPQHPGPSLAHCHFLIQLTML